MYVPSDSGSPYYVLRPIIEAYTEHSLDHAHFKYMANHPGAYEDRLGGTFVLQCESVTIGEEGAVLTLSDYFDSTRTLPIRGDKEIIKSFVDRLLVIDMEFAGYSCNGGTETRALCRRITRTPIFYNDPETFAGDEVEENWMCSYDINDGYIQKASEQPYRNVFPNPVELQIKNPRTRVEHYGRNIYTRPEMTVESEEPDWYVNIGNTIQKYVTYDGVHTAESYGAYTDLKANTFASINAASKIDNDTIRVSVIEILYYDEKNGMIYFTCPFENTSRIFRITEKSFGLFEKPTMGKGFYLVVNALTGFIDRISCADFDAGSIKDTAEDVIAEQLIAAAGKVYDIQVSGRLYQGTIRITDGSGVNDLEAVIEFLTAYKAMPLYSPAESKARQIPYDITISHLNSVLNKPKGIENTNWASRLRTCSADEKRFINKNALNYLLPQKKKNDGRAGKADEDMVSVPEHADTTLSERWSLAGKIIEKCKADEEFKKDFSHFVANEQLWRYVIHDGIYHIFSLTGEQEETLRLSRKYPDIFGYGPKNLSLFVQRNADI
jgi:hypothetical protein